MNWIYQNMTSIFSKAVVLNLSAPLANLYLPNILLPTAVANLVMKSQGKYFYGWRSSPHGELFTGRLKTSCIGPLIVFATRQSLWEKPGMMAHWGG